MGARGLQTLVQHLTIPDSLKTLAREGLPEVCIPDEELREVYLWTMAYFYRNGMAKAPSVAVLDEQFGDLISDREIEMETEPEDSIEWVIDDLKGSYVWSVTSDFNRRFSTSLSQALMTDRPQVVDQFATELVALSYGMANQETRTDARQGMENRVQAYTVRSLDQDMVYGMRLGVPEIDAYTRGIHPGELAILAAGPKVGKSWMLDLVALKEWQAGKAVTLFTMENSVEDTLDRIACLATFISYRAWQHGTCPPEDEEKVREWVRGMKEASNPLYVIQPPPGHRYVEMLVRQAQLLESDSLLIDQMSYLEAHDERLPRHLQIREITHTLHGLISTGRHRLPVLMAHQINREGVKAAQKADRLEMVHLAEGSETERTADWVFGLFRSRTEVGMTQARFQTLAARREENQHFRLTWNVGAGVVAYRGPWDIIE